MRGKRQLLIVVLAALFVVGCLSALGMHFYTKAETADNVADIVTRNETDNQEDPTTDE